MGIIRKKRQYFLSLNNRYWNSDYSPFKKCSYKGNGLAISNVWNLIFWLSKILLSRDRLYIIYPLCTDPLQQKWKSFNVIYYIFKENILLQYRYIYGDVSRIKREARLIHKDTFWSFIWSVMWKIVQVFKILKRVLLIEFALERITPPPHGQIYCIRLWIQTYKKPLNCENWDCSDLSLKGFI